MKIPNVRKSDACDSFCSGKRGAFSAALKENAEKRKEQFENSPFTAWDGEGDAQVGPSLTSVQQPAVEDAAAPEQSTDRLLPALVHEIVVQAPPAGDSSVSIQFDSKTLSGLRVKIEKAADNRLQILFSTNSAAVAELLVANLPALTSALASHGYSGPSVVVRNVRSGYGSNSSANDGSRGSGGSQGGSRR